MASAQFCHIRKFRESDSFAIRDIITEATMEQVDNFFWGAVLSELLLQICVLAIALMYIVIGVPLKYCLFAIPLTVILIYTCIWFGHWIKATELTTDLDNILSNYMSDPDTTFYVAEVYGKAGEAELASLMGKVKKVDYNFYNEREFATIDINLKGLSKTVVGTIAVTKSLHHADRAWIRRMAVKKEYRRRRIASHLLTEALEFCEGRPFTGIDLITTECHTEAKRLYTNEGFKEVEISNKSFLGIGGNQVLYHMYRPIHRHSTENKDEY